MFVLTVELATVLEMVVVIATGMCVGLGAVAVRC